MSDKNLYSCCDNLWICFGPGLSEVKEEAEVVARATKIKDVAVAAVAMVAQVEVITN
jgi:hypothetical protein